MSDPRTAMIQALSHESGPLAWSIKFTTEALERYRSHRGMGFDPTRDTQTAVVTAHTNSAWEEVRPGYFRDHFGVVWNKTRDRTLGIVEDPPLAEGLGDYVFPDPAKTPIDATLRSNLENYPDRFRMLSIGFSFFERAWSLLGMEELMCLMYDDPELVDHVLDHIAAYNEALIRRAAAIGIDAVHFGDDWGSQHGPLISPELWKRYIRPRFAANCAVAKELGLWVSLHCCGNVAVLMEDIHACGVDVFDPFQPEAMDIWSLRAQFRGRMAFWGGLSVQQVLPFGSPAEVRSETLRLIREMAPGGGYILAPSHSISADVPPVNIDAFLATIQEFGNQIVC